MKAAIIENGTVVNIAKVPDQAFADSQGWVVSDTARIGDSYDEGTGDFTPAPPAPPQLGVFNVGKDVILADGTDVSAVTFTSNETVNFVVDDELYEVEPVDSVATLNISADQSGPINVFVAGNQTIIFAKDAPV